MQTLEPSERAENKMRVSPKLNYHHGLCYFDARIPDDNQ